MKFIKITISIVYHFKYIFLKDWKNGQIPLLQSYEKNYELYFSKQTVSKFSKYKKKVFIALNRRHYTSTRIVQKDLIKENKNEFIVETTIDKKGKYGRLLGELFDPSGAGRSYNKTLVKEGHATEYFGGKR